ncbi:hypothetical protein BDY21DRAFT_105561 [Lineolata rhizophorae]|uniref:Uncharacterized protein n=1 Tax=Lineolata rhizophorae TaxID=578093 RepID=A0A6A6NSU7_9PEZI|nr:hypothetical protein BDY21DRAFT_105561 [Lineolata rhizophorae]
MERIRSSQRGSTKVKLVNPHTSLRTTQPKQQHKTIVPFPLSQHSHRPAPSQLSHPSRTFRLRVNLAINSSTASESGPRSSP